MADAQLDIFEEVAIPVVGLADFLRQHKPSRWRSVVTEMEVLRCCGEDFGPLTRRPKPGAPSAWDQWADHVAEARDA